MQGELSIRGMKLQEKKEIDEIDIRTLIKESPDKKRVH